MFADKAPEDRMDELERILRRTEEPPFGTFRISINRRMSIVVIDHQVDDDHGRCVGAVDALTSRAIIDDVEMCDEISNRLTAAGIDVERRGGGR